ncbi:MAG: hypothetical protein RL558_511, partial [Bacteroidota bacterium]
MGGAVERQGDQLRPAFAKARYWTHSRHWEWATKPNPREKASFLSENIMPLLESGQLHFIDGDSARISTPLGFDAFVANGHTDAQMCPILDHGGQTLVYMADLLPSVGHIPLPYVMGYDTRPLLTLQEKARILNEAADRGYLLFLEHDPLNEVAILTQTRRVRDWPKSKNCNFTNTMKKFFPLALCLAIGLGSASAQTGYWQQSLRYQMDVDLDHNQHRLEGKMRLEYTNNSPDALDEIFMHLYWNAFQPGSMMSNMANIPTQFKDKAIGTKIEELKP